MAKFKVINGEGYGKNLDQKFAESAGHFNVEYKEIESALAGYGSREYAIIETDQTFESEFIQSLMFGSKVIELN